MKTSAETQGGESVVWVWLGVTGQLADEQLINEPLNVEDKKKQFMPMSYNRALDLDWCLAPSARSSYCRKNRNTAEYSALSFPFIVIMAEFIVVLKKQYFSDAIYLHEKCNFRAVLVCISMIIQGDVLCAKTHFIVKAEKCLEVSHINKYLVSYKVCRGMSEPRIVWIISQATL